MFKSAFIIMAPDGDPTKHRATIKTSKTEVTAVIIEAMNFDQAVDVCKDLVQNQGVQSLYLCAGFTHQAVARGDVPTTMLVGEILTKEGWFAEER